jgi:flagellar biosynthesis/type III secretory pathway protein FliH
MRFTFLFALMVCLVACKSSPQTPELVGLAYLADKPFRLNVARVEVVKQYQSSSIPPHVENDLPVPPVAMVQQWVRDRLFTYGNKGYAVITIEDASATETPLKKKTEKASFFTTTHSEQYDAKLAVKIEIFDDEGKQKGFCSARAQGSQSTTNTMTIGQRRKLWIHLMENVMNQLDAELSQSINTHLKQYLLDS